MNREEQAVVDALRRDGVEFPNDQFAQQAARHVLAALERLRRSRVKSVKPHQCGAPTLDGHPCFNPKMVGNSGCTLHPNWRSRG